ncbi:MAG: hypothetical protein M1833_003297 [Piccolia ochrophora]|nr:MAG: hypothetical protein M1833_003297 [Piccolia ochrophora]
MAIAMPSLSTVLLFLYGASLTVADTTKSLELCTTLLGKTSKNPVPTASIGLTLTSKATVKFTVTPVVTITPSPITSTISTTLTATTTTTLPQQTDTLTTTETDFTTITIVPSTFTATVITGTTTLTTTGAVSTTTIQPPAGFKPANEVLARRDLAGPQVPRRAIAERAATPTGPIIRRGANGKVTASPSLYPTQVACARLAKVYLTVTSTATASTTATSTATPGPASTTTTTFSVTATSTELPVAASTTVTVRTTSSVTTTVVATTTLSTAVTTTVTVLPPQETLYAACQASNQLSTVNGVPINGAQFYTGASNPSAGNAYDCCVACQTKATGCGAYLFFPGPFCYNANPVGASCANAALGLFVDPLGTPDVVAGSGSCGVPKLG